MRQGDSMAPGQDDGKTLGESYDPLGAHMQDPHPLFARARAEEPVFWSPAVEAWVVTRYEDVRNVLRDAETFSSAPVLRPVSPLPPAIEAILREGYPLDPPSLIISDGALHRRLRAPAVHGLSSARVDAAEPFIRQRAEELVDAFAAEGHVELMGQYAYRLPVSVVAHLFGLAPEDEQLAYQGSYQSNRVSYARLSEAEQVEAARGSVRLHELVGRYLHARRAEPGDDLISEVVTALAPGTEPLSYAHETQVARTILTLLIAGHITTSGLIGAAVRHLLTDRAQWELLCDRPELIGNAVEETARYDGPAHVFRRRATREVTLGGHTLPPGSEVLVAYQSANRDPALCERPDTFDITREPVRHLGFGTGPHACVGASLGRREAEVTLEILTRRLPGLRLVPDQDFTIQGSLNVRSLATLHLTW
jgi:cytochrome P450